VEGEGRGIQAEALIEEKCPTSEVHALEVRSWHTAESPLKRGRVRVIDIAI
jgi:hypothetical protein